jgi:hypothetical protein
LDIIHSPAFYLKHGISETGFCISLEVEPTQMGPTERAAFCLRTPATTPTGVVEIMQQEALNRQK